MVEETTPEPLADAIGEVCLMWSLIEAHVGFLVEEEVGAALHGQVTDSLNTIVRVMVQNMELRQRIQTAKAIAVGFPENLFPRVEKLLNRIDNELRNERNRYVHDIWLLEGDGFVRVKPGTFISRQQAFKPTAKIGRHELFADISTVRAFAALLGAALSELMDLLKEFRALALKKRNAAAGQQADEA